jgi:hypothetical protein
VTANSTYTLDCTGKGGTANASVTLEIGASSATGSPTISQTSDVPTQTIVLGTPMTEVERQAKIAELRAKIMELITKLAELIKAMQKAQ